MRKFAGVVAGLLVACMAGAAEVDHQRWDALLRQHVRSVDDGVTSQVDYAGMKTSEAQLDAYLRELAAVQRGQFDGMSVPSQLALLLNAYNAWTVKLVLQSWPGLRSIRDTGNLLRSPWKRRFIPLLGEVRSLDDIEHGLIRGSGRYADPRVHFAANCASVGCPALRREAYVAERLDAQLDEQSRKFLSDRSRNRVREGRVEVSMIFKWYREDFTRSAGSLRRFLGRYSAELGSTDHPIEFLEYDWTLNAYRP